MTIDVLGTKYKIIKKKCMMKNAMAIVITHQRRSLSEKTTITTLAILIG